MVKSPSEASCLSILTLSRNDSSETVSDSVAGSIAGTDVGIGSVGPNSITFMGLAYAEEAAVLRTSKRFCFSIIFLDIGELNINASVPSSAKTPLLQLFIIPLIEAKPSREMFDKKSFQSNSSTLGAVPPVVRFTFDVPTCFAGFGGIGGIGGVCGFCGFGVSAGIGGNCARGASAGIGGTGGFGASAGSGGSGGFGASAGSGGSGGIGGFEGSAGEETNDLFKADSFFVISSNLSSR